MAVRERLLSIFEHFNVDFFSVSSRARSFRFFVFNSAIILSVVFVNVFFFFLFKIVFRSSTKDRRRKQIEIATFKSSVEQLPIDYVFYAIFGGDAI